MTSSRRVFVGAFGDPGHAFPAIALAAALVDRGCDVMVETALAWREHVEACGASFSPAPEFPVFPTLGRHLKPYEAVSAALHATRPAVADFAPDAVVHDILTLAPALAAEMEGIPVATLIPHLNPVTAASGPPFGLGARQPRTSVGAGAWRVLSTPVQRGLVRGSEEYDDLRRRVGLEPRERVHGALSDRLVLLGTFPQLEAARELPPAFVPVGPLFWEPPFPPTELPDGDGPLVLVAPSTAQDPEHLLLQAALAGLGRLPIRVLATWNRRPLPGPVRLAANTRLVEWLSYSQTIPHCSAVISHAGHGTLARTLQSGAVPIVSPWSGDQFENAGRVAEVGLGVRLPRRLLSAGSLALAVELALSDARFNARCRSIAEWSRSHDGATTAARLVEDFASDPDSVARPA